MTKPQPSMVKYHLLGVTAAVWQSPDWLVGLPLSASQALVSWVGEVLPDDVNIG